MINLANRGSLIALQNPLISPALRAMGQAAPAPAAAASAPAAGGERAITAGAAIIAGGLAITSALFSYGVAKESSSKMVRNTGYILAGVSGLAGALYVIGGPIAAAMMNGQQR
jgi:hypothetical protein